MFILADSHCHIYPGYDLDRFFASAFSNFDRLVSGIGARPPANETSFVLMLTERHDCRMFRSLASGELKPAGFLVSRASEPESLRISSADGRVLYLIAGRQLVSKERLELLALTRDLEIADGLPLDELISKVKEADSIPVLSWAVGKWMFGRGKVVRDCIARQVDQALLLGDSYLRPRGWPRPAAFALAETKGLRVIAGSDPLPQPGAELIPGSYGILTLGDFDLKHPARSLRQILRNREIPIEIVGKRAGLFEVLRRLLQHQH